MCTEEEERGREGGREGGMDGSPAGSDRHTQPDMYGCQMLTLGLHYITRNLRVNGSFE